MLENQLWMKYGNDLSIEYKQAVDEGKEVEYLKEICDQIVATSQHEDCEVLAKEVREKLIHAKVRANYPFIEPSDLNEINLQKPARRHTFMNVLSDETLKDKLSGAWIGRISGCLLGKPIECMKRDEIYPILKTTDNYPMKKYITYSEFTEELKQRVDPDKWRTWADNLKGMAPIDDDTNYTVLMMKVVQQYGKAFRPNDVLEAWLTWMPMFATCTAE
ncbi:MAG: ADP-ribosylglycohydrolase family protein, partial [Turicibacter sp.]